MMNVKLMGIMKVGKCNLNGIAKLSIHEQSGVYLAVTCLCIYLMLFIYRRVDPFVKKNVNSNTDVFGIISHKRLEASLQSVFKICEMYLFCIFEYCNL